MHILHALPGAAGALKLQSDLDMIDRCDDLEDLDLWVHHAECDAVVLDPFAQRGIGRRWAQRYRSRAGRAGLVFVVSDIEPDMAIPLYNVGDDLVRLPMRPDEVLARVGSVTRRCRGYESASLIIGRLELDAATCRTRYAGRDLLLTPREFCLVEFLMLRAGQVVSKEAVMTRIYQERDEAEIKIVDVMICKIRRKLADLGAPADLIRTAWGNGYTIVRPSAPVAHVTPALRSVA